MTEPSRKPRRPSGMQRDATPARTLIHLAENGPTERRELFSAVGDCSTTRMAFSRLQDLGLLKVKVWLTPEGLAECKRMGWKPELAGVMSGEPHEERTDA